MAHRGDTRRERGPEGGGLSYAGLWALAAVVVLAAVFVATRGDAATHPEPRPGVDGSRVVPASRFAGHPRTQEVYREAAQVPETLDGLYCYCRCRQHSGHYSLLDCFANDHAARCDVCMSEAALAYRLTEAGKTLNQVRHAVDRLFGN
jgi:hypothetical protein